MDVRELKDPTNQVNSFALLFFVWFYRPNIYILVNISSVYHLFVIGVAESWDLQRHACWSSASRYFKQTGEGRSANIGTSGTASGTDMCRPVLNEVQMKPRV